MKAKSMEHDLDFVKSFQWAVKASCLLRCSTLCILTSSVGLEQVIKKQFGALPCDAEQPLGRPPERTLKIINKF